MQFAIPFRINASSFLFFILFFVANFVLFAHSRFGLITIIIIAIESVLHLFFFSGLNFYHFDHEVDYACSEFILFYMFLFCLLCLFRFVSNFVFVGILAHEFICNERKIEVFILSTGCKLTTGEASASAVLAALVYECIFGWYACSGH